ncbi:MAG: sialidase family protein [Candidatus Thermoplasmatota archaeon]
MLAPRLVIPLALLILALPALTAGSSPPAPVFSPAVAVGAHVGEPGLRLAPSGDIFVHYPGGLYRSLDAGASFSRVGLAATVIFGGDADLSILKDGTLLYADLSGVTISVARSTTTTGSGPWVQTKVKGGVTTDVKMAGSNDHGKTWTAPLRLTTATSAGVMPWAIGGSGGRVGIVWYASDVQSSPSTSRASYVMFARQTDGPGLLS